MRRSRTTTRSSRLAAFAAVAAVSACAARPPEPDDLPASRADVTVALYRQLDAVLARHDRLDGDGTDDAAAERADLLRLAAEITVRIARIDPDVDLDALSRRMEKPR